MDSGSLCLRVYVVRGFSYAGFSARLWFVDSRFHGNDEAGRRQGAGPLAGDKPQRYRPPLSSPWSPAFAGVTNRGGPAGEVPSIARPTQGDSRIASTVTGVVRWGQAPALLGSAPLPLDSGFRRSDEMGGGWCRCRRGRQVFDHRLQ